MTRQIHIIGVDPGRTVGVAELCGTAFESWQLERVDALSHMRGLLERSRRVVVVSERFIIGTHTVRKTRQADALEVCTLVHQLCDEYRSHVTFALQLAADAKRRVPDRHLRLFGWYRPGQDHANDAARHVGLALLRLHPVVIERMVHPSIV